MDLYFPRDDQRLLFEKLDTTHSLKLPVTQILHHYSSQTTPSPHHQQQVDLSHGSQQQAEEKVEKDLQRYLEETDIKDLILSKIEGHRGTSKLVESPRQTKLQLVRALRNLDPKSTGNISVEKLTWALGPEYLDLGLTNQEVQTTLKISKGVDLKNNQINYSRFVENLKIRNTDPICDPFFDRRANQITRLKQRLNGLHEFSSDPAILARRDELMKICMVGPGEDGIEKYLDPSRPATLFQPLSPSPLLKSCQSQPSFSASRASPDSTIQPYESIKSGSSSPIRYPGGSHHAIDTTTQVSDRNDSGRPEERTGIVDGKVVKTGHFRATSNAPSRTYVKYPMTVDVRRAHVDHKESIPGGKRHGPTQSYDGTMLHHNHTTSSGAPPMMYRYEVDERGNDQHFGNEPAAASASTPTVSSRQEDDNRFLNLSQSLPNLSLSSLSYTSTNDQYYTPLDYQPSKPVSRPGVISDAMRSALERDVSPFLCPHPHLLCRREDGSATRELEQTCSPSKTVQS